MVDSAKGKAEDVRAGFDTLRVLVDAVDTQLGFFIREKGMFGPYRELIRSHALDIPWCCPASCRGRRSSGGG